MTLWRAMGPALPGGARPQIGDKSGDLPITQGIGVGPFPRTPHTSQDVDRQISRPLAARQRKEVRGRIARAWRDVAGRTEARVQKGALP